jgi:prolyl 4-hydroxylase
MKQYDGMTSNRRTSRPVKADLSAQREAVALDHAGRHLEAIAVLSRAAAAGDLVAKRTVGLRILLGDRAPPMGPDGVRLIAEAATQGDAGSAELSAVLSGAGIHCAQDWAKALDWLELAAGLGSRRAGSVLSVLCADRELAAGAAAPKPPESLWRELRANVDIAKLVSPPPLRTHHHDPLIRSACGFADPWLCDWLIAQARGRLTRAEVYNPHTGGLEQTPERSNSSALMSLLDTDLAQIILQARIGAAVGKPFSHLEPAFVLHYAPGQTFHDHYDFVDPETPGYEQDIARNGQRVVTFLLYLNDDYEGGQTDFPLIDFQHKGAMGEGFFFVNVRPDGEADTRTLHAGRPPTSGEKWVLSQFIRDRALVPGYAPG